MIKVNRASCAFVCSLTAGTLRGVPVPAPTSGQTTTLENKIACVFSYLKVQITANSGLPVVLELHFDTVETLLCWEIKHGCPPATFHLVSVVFERGICKE